MCRTYEKRYGAANICKMPSRVKQAVFLRFILLLNIYVSRGTVWFWGAVSRETKTAKNLLFSGFLRYNLGNFGIFDLSPCKIWQQNFRSFTRIFHPDLFRDFSIKIRRFHILSIVWFCRSMLSCLFCVFWTVWLPKVRLLFMSFLKKRCVFYICKSNDLFQFDRFLLESAPVIPWHMLFLLFQMCKSCDEMCHTIQNCHCLVRFTSNKLSTYKHIHIVFRLSKSLTIEHFAVKRFTS